MRGTYTLLLLCREPFRARIGSLGYANVDEGYYLYTGSALGNGSLSLERRLERHCRRAKKVRWHVDYLTSNPRCVVKVAVCLRSRKRSECAINKAVIRRMNAKPILSHAGSSDCKCDAHLTKIRSSIGADKILRSLMNVYRRFGKAVYYVQFAHCGRRAM